MTGTKFPTHGYTPDCEGYTCIICGSGPISHAHDDELKSCLRDAYAVLGDIRTEFPYRHTEAGQRFLNRLLSVVAAFDRMSEQETQDLCTERSQRLLFGHEIDS